VQAIDVNYGGQGHVFTEPIIEGLMSETKGCKHVAWDHGGGKFLWQAAFTTKESLATLTVKDIEGHNLKKK
jgi:hypothetical protein